MGIKIDPANPSTYIVSHSKRHPITNVPYSLKRKGFKSLAEAKRAYSQVIIDIEEKIRAKQIPTWEKTLTLYFESCRTRGISEKTIVDYSLCLNAHTTPSWGSRLVDSISTQEIRVLLEERTKGKSIGHQKNLLKMIRGVFKFAFESGFVDRNPVPEIHFKRREKIMPVLTQAQAALLLNRAKESKCEWYPHWAMALYTGMRNGELYALTWEKVNFETQQIKVDCSWNPNDGFKSTKSGDDRIVDISPPLMHILRELKLQDPHSNFVLPRMKKWDLGDQAQELRFFLMGVGLPQVRFHDLRATWATMLLSNGVEPLKVMTMGGWKDFKTMQMYARKAGVDVKGATGCLSDLHDPTTRSAKVLKLGSCSDL